MFVTFKRRIAARRKDLEQLLSSRDCSPVGRNSGITETTALKRWSFTLIEAVMVIVMLGILYFVAQPKFDTFYNLKLKTAAKKLISDIRYAQNLAVSRHEDYAVSFDVNGENYRVYRVSDGELAKDPFTNTDLIVDFTTDSQYRGINIYSVNFGDGNVLRFDWRGVPKDNNGNDLTAQGVVHLKYRSWTLEVDVTPHTGRVSWQ